MAEEVEAERAAMFPVADNSASGGYGSYGGDEEEDAEDEEAAEDEDEAEE